MMNLSLRQFWISPVLRVGLMVVFFNLTGCIQAISPRDPVVKNVILLIGDGMGPQQLGLLTEYARHAPHSIYQSNQGVTAFDRFARAGLIGLSSHSPANRLVTDSACSATQLASGMDSDVEMIGLDRDGNRVETILEKAKHWGKSTGLVSDTRITHATPAAFAAHQRHRSMENEIAKDMLQNQNVDVMLSGGLRHFLPQQINTDPSLQEQVKQLVNDPNFEFVSKREDDENLLESAAQLGYQRVFNESQLMTAQGPRVLGLFADSHMQDAIDYHSGRQSNQPSLAQMTQKALEILDDNPNGFFLMIEGGQIDWAGHNNDAGTLLHEMIRFEEAVQAVWNWAQQREDTLVIITADHETGGFGFSYSRYQIPEAQTLPGAYFQGASYQPRFNYGHPNILDRLYQQQKSFTQIWNEFKTTSPANADQLMEQINHASAFKIDQRQAERILAEDTEDTAGVAEEPKRSYPLIHDFKEFYVYGDNGHIDLIGRELAKDQNVVWATGAHTHTPVPIIAWGPEKWIKPLSGLLHHTEIGRLMIQALTPSQPESIQ